VFLAAAAVMALGTATVGVWPLRDVAGLDRDLAVFMPDPALVGEPDPDEGPVLVTLTYTVEDDQVPAFVEVMGEVRRSRLRTGASSCELYQDGADPSQFLQVSQYRTWGEHLRQHTGHRPRGTRGRQVRVIGLLDQPMLHRLQATPLRLKGPQPLDQRGFLQLGDISGQQPIHAPAQIGHRLIELPRSHESNVEHGSDNFGGSVPSR